MGKIEQRAKRKRTKRNIKRAILVALGSTALIGAAIAVPNLPSALYKLGLLKISSDKSGIARARQNLLKRGLLIRNQEGLLRLTSRGGRELRRLETRAALEKKPHRWDGRWRILIFDIPEYRKAVRNKIRRTLISIGFLRLQDSVWIYPYDSEEFIALLKADYKIGKDVLYMVVEELEGDRRIRDHFQLHGRKHF